MEARFVIDRMPDDEVVIGVPLGTVAADGDFSRGTTNDDVAGQEYDVALRRRIGTKPFGRELAARLLLAARLRLRRERRETQREEAERASGETHRSGSSTDALPLQFRKQLKRVNVSF